MPRYLIAYDLTKDLREYDILDTRLRALDPNWMLGRVLESTWLIETDQTPAQILTALAKTDLEGNNRFLVLGITGPWAALRLRTDVDLKKWFGPPTGPDAQ